MLFLLVKHFVWFFVTLVFGVATIQLLSVNKGLNDKPISAPLYNLVGLAILSLITAILHFFIPIGVMANLIIWAVTIFLGWLYINPLKMALSGWRDVYYGQSYWLLISVGVVLYFASQQSTWIDEGVYHAQFIKWTENYKIIPGLGNVQHRLAFNSHWHLLSALMNGAAFTGQESNHINSLMYFLVFSYFLTGISNLREQPFTSLLKMVGLLGMHLPYITAYHIIPPSADYALMLLMWVMFVLAIQKWETDSFFAVDVKLLVLVLLGVFLVTVKISAAPLLYLPGVMVIGALIKNRGGRFLGGPIVLALLFWGTWIGRNYVLSGYFVFPVGATGFLDPVWKVGTPLVEQSLEGITRMGYILYKPNAIFLAPTDPLAYKLKVWFLHNLRLYDQFLLVVAVVAPLSLLLVIKWFKAQYADRVSTFLLLLVAPYLGLVYWLATAPDPRFGLGYQVMAIALGVIPILIRLLGLDLLSKLAKPLLIFGVLFCWVATFGIYFYIKGQFIAQGRLPESSPAVSTVLMPCPYPEVPTSLQNGFYVVKDIRTCWGHELPCMEYYDEHVEMIGNNVEEGFKYTE